MTLREIRVKEEQLTGDLETEGSESPREQYDVREEGERTYSTSWEWRQEDF